MTIIEELFNNMSLFFSEFVKTNSFHDFALAIIFIVAGTPSFFFIPNEAFTIPAYVLGVSPLLILLAVGFGGFCGDSLIYFVSKHIHKKYTGNEIKHASHWLYKYKHIVFVISPTLFFGIGDLIMVLAGIRHLNYLGIAPFVLIGNFIRAILGIIVIVYGIELFSIFF